MTDAELIVIAERLRREIAKIDPDVVRRVKAYRATCAYRPGTPVGEAMAFVSNCALVLSYADDFDKAMIAAEVAANAKATIQPGDNK